MDTERRAACELRAPSRFRTRAVHVTLTIIASLKPGDTVGWSSVVPPHRYALSGYCKSKTTLLEIDRDTLEVLIEANYHLGYIFMRNVAVLAGERVHHVQNKLAMLLADEATTGW